MKQSIKTLLVALALTIGIGSFAAAPVGAINVFKGIDGTDTCPAGSESSVCAGKTETVTTPVQTVISVLLFAIGVISVIMIIVGGLRYTISNGDSSKITQAKNTILYAVVGLVVAILSGLIVRFVVGSF